MANTAMKKKKGVRKMDNEKMVFFDKYCTSCKHEAVNEEDDPCDECLRSYAKENSHKPLKWEAKES